MGCAVGFKRQLVAGRCEWLADRRTWKFSCSPQPQRSTSRLGWQVDIRICQCADYRDVLSQWLTGLPRSHGKSVRAPAISSCQMARLFHHWNTGCGQRPCYDVIDSMMSDYPAWCLFRDQATKAASVYRRSTATCMGYTDAATKTQSDCHTDCVVRVSVHS